MNTFTDNNSKRFQERALIARVASDAKKAIVTGPAGARLYDLSTHAWVTQVDLILPSGHTWGTQRTYADRAYHGAMIDPDHVVETNSIKHAPLIRCLFDSFRYHGRSETLVQLESARWKWKKLTTNELLKRTETLPRAKGLREFRKLIEYSAATSQSPLETLVRDIILTAIEKGELPEVHSVEFQVAFIINNRDGMAQMVRVDILINGFLVIELDGRIKTDGTFGDPEAITLEERHRETELQNKGLVVRRAGWASTLGDEIIQLIKKTLATIAEPLEPPIRAREEPAA